jgi:ATP-dependent Lon protease
LSFIRSNAAKLGIADDFFEDRDLHIHVPAGAIPKDGPSAGIAMATALVSVLTDRKINKDVAMTGEITLRGRVLPIGGLKEKALGALRAGIHTIVIPAKNQKDLAEIPSNVKRRIKFVTVSQMDEVLDLAFGSVSES